MLPDSAAAESEMEMLGWVRRKVGGVMGTRILILLAVAFSTPLRGVAQSSGADDAQIRTLIEVTLPGLYNAGDGHGIAALWTDTATHGGLVRGARLRNGRAEIEQMWASLDFHGQPFA